MTQPKFAPIPIEDEVRPAAKLAVPRPWSPHRPAERRPGPTSGTRGGGAPGPDQGYALSLAERIAPRVVLGAGEHAEDALAAAVAIAMKRAACYGRAPVFGDVEFALAALGYLSAVDEGFAHRRHELVGGTAHDYARQRAIADRCSTELLRGAPGALGAVLFDNQPEPAA